jgi:hypothetical protein
VTANTKPPFENSIALVKEFVDSIFEAGTADKPFLDSDKTQGDVVSE